MKSLTPKIAEDFAKKLFSQLTNIEDRAWHLLHSKSVAATALILVGNRKIDKETLEIAGWLHDIGSVISREGHAKKSIELLEKESFELSEKLRDCILEHGNGGNPKTEEGKIIKVADKVSILHPEIVKMLLSCNKGKIKEEDLNFIRKLTSGAVELLEDFDIK